MLRIATQRESFIFAMLALCVCVCYVVRVQHLLTLPFLQDAVRDGVHVLFHLCSFHDARLLLVEVGEDRARANDDRLFGAHPVQGVPVECCARGCVCMWLVLFFFALPTGT